MSIYGNYLIEGFFSKKSKDRIELKSIETIINKYINSLNNKFFHDVKINKKSFSEFTSKKSDSFYLEFRSNISEPKIMKQMFSEFGDDFEKNISKLKKDVEENISNFKITFKIKKSNLTLEVLCKEK